MRIGVISDIHGNLKELKNTIKFLEESNCKIFCLGDLVSDDSEYNSQCIHLLIKKQVCSVIGQHDDTCLKTGLPQVDKKSLEYLKSMKVTVEFENALFIHDNPLSNAQIGKGMWKEGSYIKSLIEAQVVTAYRHQPIVTEYQIPISR